jgi:hypothetical protein
LKWNVKLDSAPKGTERLDRAGPAFEHRNPQRDQDILIVGGQTALEPRSAHRQKAAGRSTLALPLHPERPPAIVGNTAYFLASDGRLTGLNVADDTRYTATSQQCNGVGSAVYAIDLKGFFHTVNSSNTAPKGGAGMWGRAGVALASDGSVFAETGDGPNDPAKGRFADSFIKLSAHDLKLLDYYTPLNREYLTKKDLDKPALQQSGRGDDRQRLLGKPVRRP